MIDILPFLWIKLPPQYILTYYLNKTTPNSQPKMITDNQQYALLDSVQISVSLRMSF